MYLKLTLKFDGITISGVIYDCLPEYKLYHTKIYDKLYRTRASSVDSLGILVFANLIQLRYVFVSNVMLSIIFRYFFKFKVL